MRRRCGVGWRIWAACACACVAVLASAADTLANGQRTRPSGWPQTGSVVLPGLGYDRNRETPYPTHRPPGCAHGFDCIACVAGCRPPGQHIVARVARSGPVSNWQLRRRIVRDPNTVIACYAGGCSGQGAGPLSRSHDVNITVHSYRHGW